jgi:hypothetical protein
VVEKYLRKEDQGVTPAQRGWAVVYFHPAPAWADGATIVEDKAGCYIVFPVAAWGDQGRPMIALDGHLQAWSPELEIRCRGKTGPETLKDGFLSPPTHPKAWR